MKCKQDEKDMFNLRQWRACNSRVTQELLELQKLLCNLRKPGSIGASKRHKYLLTISSHSSHQTSRNLYLHHIRNHHHSAQILQTNKNYPATNHHVRPRQQDVPSGCFQDPIHPGKSISDWHSSSFLHVLTSHKGPGRQRHELGCFRCPGSRCRGRQCQCCCCPAGWEGSGCFFWEEVGLTQ